MRTTERIAIVGAGPAGLAAALALLENKQKDPHRQYQIELWDTSSPADYFNTSAGAAVQITPNGMTALHALSAKVCRAVLQEASRVQSNVMILPSQQTLYDTLQPLPPDPPSSFPTVMIRWGIFRQLLLDAVMSSSYNRQQCQWRLQHKVTGFRHVPSTETTITEQQVCLEYYTDNKHNEATRMISEPYSLVIAADGKGSAFRPTPIEPSSPRVNFKAVVQHSSTMTILPNMAHTTYSWLSSSIPCFVGPAGVEGWLYWGLAVPRELALHFNMSNPKFCKQQLLQLLSQQKHDARECQVYLDLIAATPETVIYRQESTQAAIPARLDVAPNVVLVGDAAHAMNSSYGQATSFALEDAVTLAYCLSRHSTANTTIHDDDKNNAASSLADRLDDYSRQRVHRCLEMQQKSQQRLAMAMKGQETSHITQWIHHYQVPGKAKNAVKREQREDDDRTSIGAVPGTKQEEDKEDHMIAVVA